MRKWSLWALAILAGPAMAQAPLLPATLPEATVSTATVADPSESPVPLSFVASGTESSAASGSNRNFPNFIGFISNPLQSIDPRSLTQVVPLFGATSVSAIPALPKADFQIVGPAISLALTERFSVGLNQGGYAFARFNRNDRSPVLPGRFPVLADRLQTLGQAFGGDRSGFLDLGGYAQYTLIEDVPDQFLMTGGVRLIVPSGSTEIFQGKGPAQLAPYLAAGKELGNFHVLATTGYQFPARTGSDEAKLFYLNVHVDRQCFGWLYPLVEFNWTNQTSSVDVNLPTRRGYVDFGNFDSTGNLVTLGVGANAVLIRDRLELGAVYTTPIAARGKLDFDGVLVKMVLRY